VVGAFVVIDGFVCALLAWYLAKLAHVDALTAYLANQPRRVDSVAIIGRLDHRA